MIAALMLTDDEVEILMQEVPEWAGSIRAKLAHIRALPVPHQTGNRSKYGWDRLLREQSPLEFHSDSISLPELSRRAHNWASYQKLKIATRIKGEVLLVWLLGAHE